MSTQTQNTENKTNTVVNNPVAQLPTDAKQLQAMLEQLEKEEQAEKERQKAMKDAKKAVKAEIAKQKEAVENQVFTDSESTIVLNLRASNKRLLQDSTRYKTIENAKLTALVVAYLTNPEKVNKFIAEFK